MTVSVNRRYIPEIDQIRAFAALLVFMYHGFQLIGAELAFGRPFDPALHWVHSNNPLVAIVEEGHSGVGLFIVLSGYILSMGAVGGTISYSGFLVSRILRIYPMLIVCAVVSAHVSKASLLSVLASILPFNTPDAAGSVFSAMFWAVAVEFQCYFVFPFLIAFSRERGTKFLVQIVVLAILLRLLAVFASGADPRDLSYWTVVGRIDQFCIGMITARLVGQIDAEKGGLLRFAGAATAMGVLLFVFNHLGGWPTQSLWKIFWPTIEGSFWAIFMTSWLRVGRYLPASIGRWTAKFGEVSYSFYLLHFAVIAAIVRHGLFLRATGDAHVDALITTVLIAFPLTTIFAMLTFETIEMPFLRLRRKYLVGKI